MRPTVGQVWQVFVKMAKAGRDYLCDILPGDMVYCKHLNR